MFQALFNIASGVESLQMTITAGDNGKMKVCIAPKVRPGQDSALGQPLALSATPEELDAGFIEAISVYQSARSGVAEQAAATAAVLDASKQQLSAKAVKALSGNSTSKSSENAPEDEDEGDDLATQKATPVTGTATAAPPKAPAPISGTDLSALL